MIYLIVHREREAWAAYRAYVVAKMKLLRGHMEIFTGDARSAQLFRLWRAARARREEAA